MSHFKKITSIATLTTLIALSSCSKPYDYTGVYSLTTGDQCNVEQGDNTLITISTANIDSNTTLYTARLSSAVAAGVFPVESKPSGISEDGSLTFHFFKEGEKGWVSSKPSVDMTLKLRSKDSSHIILSKWIVKMNSPKSATLGSKFDFVNDSHIQMLGQNVSNGMSEKKGKDGLCLKKKPA